MEDSSYDSSDYKFIFTCFFYYFSSSELYYNPESDKDIDPDDEEYELFSDFYESHYYK